MSGGSIQSVSINRRKFSVAADADSNRQLGGFSKEVQMNGDGTARDIMTRVPLSLDGLVLDCQDNRGDHEFLQGIADTPGFVPITITYVTGSTWQGSGTVEGEVVYSSKNGTCTVALKGTGKLTVQ